MSEAINHTAGNLGDSASIGCKVFVELLRLCQGVSEEVYRDLWGDKQIVYGPETEQGFRVLGTEPVDQSETRITFTLTRPLR